MASNLKQVSATGNVDASARELVSAVLTPAAAASSVEFRDGAGGPVLLTLKAVANGASVPWMTGDGAGVPFQSTIHVTIAGAGALVTCEYN
jgi:hypothetical protein